MDILRMAYVKSSIFKELNGFAQNTDLTTLVRKFNEGNYSALVMRALTGWNVGRITQNTPNDWDSDASNPGLFSNGFRWPLEWGFDDWINEFKVNPQKYVINTSTSKQNTDIPQKYRDIGIVSNHAFSVTFEDDKAILKNPLYSSSTPITIAEFKEIFDNIEYAMVPS
ncbi:MAG: hypothetical protein SFU25_04920, partial [Candidatus Caenarcaniphilales bacterium]|nr:hypothetical protein [Candidatus Caenarcaniphilales bacterium]